MSDGAPAAERRRGDRRRADRRHGDRPPSPPRPPAEESWFGALGVGPDTEFHGEGATAPGALPGAAGGADTQAARLPRGPLPSREARRIAAADDSAQRRVLRTYIAARAVLGMAINVAPWSAVLLGGARPGWPVLLVCALYALQALVLWWWPALRVPQPAPPSPGLGRGLWLATIGVDLVAFGALHAIDLTSNLNLGALLVLPVLMAGVISSRSSALATAAGVTLLLLVVGALRWTLGNADGALLLTQAGLAGIGLFVIALLAGELASRLAREELAARGSLELARQQAQLNRLVIDEMAEGVLVVDRGGRVRAANPAARTLLAAGGMVAAAPFPLQADAAWGALARAVEQAFEDGYWPPRMQELTLDFGGERRTLQLRARFTRRRAGGDDDVPPEELCVLFLEDLRAVQARLQQEKLAAMGRVSAGIAHEIRNPLAAIAQANALMLEDELAPDHQRLAQMVADNVERLKRIVEDVLEVAPGSAPQPHAFDVVAAVAATCSDWARTVGLPLGAESRLQAELPREPMGVLFDHEHLRRVLVNLLDNARRHASERPGAVRLQVGSGDDGGVTISVASDGPPIPPEVERHLFEPFFSTRSRGTGLGLYICRELCARYGAGIEYHPHGAGERHRNEFRLSMRRVTLPEAESRLHL